MLDAYLTQTGERQKDFAARAGISQAYLSQIMNGHRRPSLAVAARIARATGNAVPLEIWLDGATGSTGDAA